MRYWKTKSLSDSILLGPQYGANAAAVPYDSSLPRYIRITDVDNDGNLIERKRCSTDLAAHQQYLLQENDVLLARSGATVGKSYIHKRMTGPAVFAGYFIRFQTDPRELLPKYLYWYTKSESFNLWISSKKRVAAQPNINGQEYSRLLIPVPPPKEQTRIVELLDQADALRKLRTQADKKAARILPALFHHYFGDPANYPIKIPLEDVVSDGPQYGANASAVNWNPQLPRYIRITDVNSVGRLIDAKKSSVNATVNSPYLLAGNDILFARSGATVGKTYIHKDTSHPAIFAGYLIRFRADKSKLLPDYLFSVTQSEYYRTWVKGKQRAAAQPNINGREYSELKIPVPPISEQTAFVSNLHDLNKIAESTICSKQKLEDLFQLLLYRAFTGELTAQWREDHISELVEEMAIQSKS